MQRERMVKKKEPTFEEAIEELEKITRDLENGNLSLDESIQSYEKGMELKKLCLGILEKAEKKLEYLERKEDEWELKRKPINEEKQDGLF